MTNSHGFNFSNPFVEDDEDEGPVTEEIPAENSSQTVAESEVNEGEGPAVGKEATAEHHASHVTPEPSPKRERTAAPLPASLQRTKTFSQSRFELNEQHRKVFEWLETARYSSREQVAIWLDLPLRPTGKLLDKLIRHGYVGRKKYASYPTAYYLTPWAKSEIESETPPVDPDTGPGFVRHTLAAAWVILGLVKRKSPLTLLVESLLERPATLADFVNEAQLGIALGEERDLIRQRLEAENRTESNFVHRPTDAEIKERQDKTIRSAIAKGQGKPDRSFRLAHALAIGSRGKPHKPDLMLISHEISPEQGGKQPAVALAFEIERSHKPTSLHSMMEAYRPEQNAHLDGCVWITGPEVVLRRVAGYFPAPDHFIDAMVERLKQAQSVSPGPLKREVPRALLEAKVDLSAAIQTTGDEFHQVVRGSDEQAWKVEYLAALNLEAEKLASKDRTARAMGAWHVKASLAPEPCACGRVCRAKHGRFRSEPEARTKARHLTTAATAPNNKLGEPS